MTASAAFQTGTMLFQPGYQGTIAFQLVNPVGGRTNFLTAQFTGAELEGMVGGTTLDLTVQQTPITTGATLLYSSDFISFADSTSRSFDLTFNLSSPLSGPADLQHFQAISSTASFSANPLPQAIPEPSTLALGALGLMSLLGLCRKRCGRAHYREVSGAKV
jgi:hypothetical protein